MLVLSHKLWQRMFGGDPQIVGRQVTTQRRKLYRCGRDATAVSISAFLVYACRDVGAAWICDRARQTAVAIRCACSRASNPA